jgi:hypothetical protein
MIRVVLPTPLKTLAQVQGEVKLDVEDPVTQASVLDALERDYPVLRGTLRDQQTHKRRPFVRFFACKQDLSHIAAETPLPEPILRGDEPFLVIGAMAGG